jgi:capsular polysaccharide biosynthesis protein
MALIAFLFVAGVVFGVILSFFKEMTDRNKRP